MEAVSINSVDELVAAVPHMLGFEPSESVVVVPMGAGPPVARVDLPSTRYGQVETCGTLLEAYLQHAAPGTELAVVCFAANSTQAEAMSGLLRGELRSHGIDVPLRAVVTASEWTDLDTGMGGFRSAGAKSLMAAQFVAAGRVAPAENREELAQRLVGDPTPVAAALHAARISAQVNGVVAERAWALTRIAEFRQDGRSLDNPDTARLLLAVQDIGTRDAALLGITRPTAPQSHALWADATKRAPEEVRATAATLAGFAAWLSGDGASAWVALDRVPTQDPPRLAQLLEQMLQQAVPPSAWDSASISPGPEEGNPRTEPSAPPEGVVRTWPSRDRGGPPRTAEPPPP